MASAPSRSAAPLVLGAAAILLIAFGVFWMLDDAPPDEGSSAVPRVVDGDRDAGDVPTPMDLPEVDRQEPTPIRNTVDQPTPPITEDSSWEEPLVVTGWVEDPTEKRLPDVEVNLFDDLGDYLDSVYTDAEGRFAFYSEEGLPPGWGVGTEPELLDPDDPTALVPAFHQHATAVLPGQTPVQVKLVMSRPPRIEGKVYDAETLEPVELADVEVVAMAPAWLAEFQDAYTDEAGFYSMNLVDVPREDIILRVSDDEDRYQIVGPFSLQPGEVRVIDVGLTEPQTLEGVVLDAADGTPVGGAEVTVLPAHLEFEGADAWDITDDEGGFYIDDVGTPLDRVWLLVAEDEYGPALVHVDDPRAPVEVRLGEHVTVSGTVTDAETGDPVADAEVLFILSGPSGLLDDYEDLDYTDEDGTFSILLEAVPPQGAVLIVESEDHVKYRVPLSELAPVELDLRSYDVAVSLRPIPVL